jgi:predicted metal-dependent phosphoesterase TrpH
MPVSWERVKEIGGTESIGRPHIAQALLEKGYVRTLKEAFDRYIGWGGPAYVERPKVSPADAAATIIKAGGLPVLAHPLTVADPETMILELKAMGLVGIEAYYGAYSTADITWLVGLAAKYGLLTTGGSDFHGLDEKTETGMGNSGAPMKCALDLMALARARSGGTAA